MVTENFISSKARPVARNLKVNANLSSTDKESLITLFFVVEYRAIKLNYKNTCSHVIVVLRVPSTIHENALRGRNMADCANSHAGTVNTAFHSQGR